MFYSTIYIYIYIYIYIHTYVYHKKSAGGRLLEKAAEGAGLEGLGKEGEKSGVQSAKGGEVGEGAAEDHVRLVLDLAAGAEAAHSLRALEAHARGVTPRRRRGRGGDTLLRRGCARGRRRR